MCQAFEPATSTQDKSLSAVGVFQHELRGEPPDRRRLVSFSFPLSFSLFFLFFLFLFYFFLVMLFRLRYCYFYVVSVPPSLFVCTLLRFKLVFFFCSRAAFLEGRRILGYLGRHSTPWIPEGLADSRILESSNPSEQNCGHRSRVGSLNLWILEFFESEISRSSSPRILRHSIFGILNLQILGFSNPRILRSPRS